MALKLYPIVQQRLNNNIANEIISTFGKTISTNYHKVTVVIVSILIMLRITKQTMILRLQVRLY